MQLEDVLVRVWSFRKETDCACLDQRQYLSEGKGEPGYEGQGQSHSRIQNRWQNFAFSMLHFCIIQLKDPVSRGIILLAFLRLPLH